MESQDFLQEYVEEVREHLQELEKSLLLLEREGKARDEISQLFRAAHSIKGASAYMGFEQIAHLTHELESLFSEVQANALEVTPVGITTLLSCVDYIGKAVGQLQESGSEPSVPDSLLAALQSIRREGATDKPEDSPGFAPDPGDTCDLEVDFSSVDFPDLSPAAAERSEPHPSAASASTADLPERRPMELEEDDTELMSIFVASFQESFDQVYGVLASLDSSPLKGSELQQIVSHLRRLHASSQYMDFEKVADLVLTAEEIVRRGHERSLSRSAVLREFWSSCVEPLKSCLPALELPDFRPVEAEVRRDSEPDSFQEDDEELLSIYLETFHQHILKVASLNGPGTGGTLTETRLDEARQIIRKLIASSQYMDYDHVAGLLIEWEEKLLETAREVLADPARYDDLLHTFAGRLEAAFPAFGSLLPPRKPCVADSFLFDLDEEIDRSFNAFEMATLGDDAEVGCPSVDEIEGIKAENPAPLVSHESQKALRNEPPRRSGQSERTPTAPEEMPASATLRVDAQKVDQLLNQVGELVVTRSEFVQTVMTFREMLRELATQGKLSKHELRKLRLIGFRLHESTLSLGRVANDLQDSSMRIRMLPIAQLFQRFPRIARDQALKLNKKLELLIEGGETEIDKRVLEQMHDPLVQFLRNAIAHGIEAPEERVRAGKPEVGSIRLAAYHEGDYVALEIEDDGRGIDTEKLKKVLQRRGEMSPAEIERLSEDDLKYAIFLPGLSTREAVDGNAGRGVGLDVVKENVERMNGTIEVFSVRGHGTRFLIRIPLTVAIIRALLVKAAEQIFTLPLTSVTEILRYKRGEVHTIEGFEVISLRGKTIPIVHLNRLLNLPDEAGDKGNQFIIIVSTSFRDVGLVVGGLMGEREVVIKPIEDDFHAFRGFSGATVLGDGTVSLIVDVSALLRMMRDTMGSHPSASEDVRRGLLH